jgi:hypothetical protein
MCGPTRGAHHRRAHLRGAGRDAGRRRSWPRRAKSSSRPATTTARSARWRASSARPCRCSSSERDLRQPGLCHAERGAGQGAALRRVRAGGRQAAQVDGDDALPGAGQRALEVNGPGRPAQHDAQALHMGDECHNRNKAGTSLFIRTRSRPRWCRRWRTRTAVTDVLRFIDGNDHFYLNLSMPAMKAMLMPAENIPGCTLVTTMARNGTDWGIRVSGRRSLVHCARAVRGRPVAARLHGRGRKPGHRRQRDHRDGRHRRVRAGRRAGNRQVRRRHPGRRAERDAGDVRDHAGRAPRVHDPALNFRGTPVGIDVRKVMRTGITPRLNTGIAHRSPAWAWSVPGWYPRRRTASWPHSRHSSRSSARRRRA